MVVADSAVGNPFTDAGEITVNGKDGGLISQAHGYASFGEKARRVRNTRGRAIALWLGGTRLLPEAPLVAELTRRYGGKPRSSPTTSSRKRRRP